MTENRPADIWCGRHRFRVGPWHGDRTIAYVVVAGSGRAPTLESARQCLRRVQELGYTSVVTAALRSEEAAPFRKAGLPIVESLHVLRHDLRHLAAIEASPSVTLRRGNRRRDLRAALDVDQLSFDAFWRLDSAGLREAIDATSFSRFRIAEAPSIIGYAICGRAADTGYLQRLAVHPDHGGRGIGTRLVLDALHWARRRGATSVLVNTQAKNTGAFALYRRLGFVPQPEPLTVLGDTW